MRGAPATLRKQDLSVHSREGHGALGLIGVCCFRRIEVGGRGGAEQRKSSVKTCNWIQVCSAFSLQDAALASQGHRQDLLEPRGSNPSGLGVMVSLPQAGECPRSEALWSQRLPTGRRAVTRGQQKPLGAGVAQGAGKHRCPYLQAIGSAGSESPLGASPPPATSSAQGQQPGGAECPGSGPRSRT